MKISQKCRHSGDDDADVCFMEKVNKGAQKIMVVVPDQLAVVFMWFLFTGGFIVFLMTVTCVILKIESPAFPSAALTASLRERCPTASKHPLVARLDVHPGDVHYVFLDDDDRIPQLSACSLESAVNACPGDGSGRVNVFVVGGIRRPVNHNRTLSEVSLSSSLADLKATYGDDRLNVSHVSLEECLECSPFQGMDLSGRPTLAKFVVKLVVLWQFGGTVLDDSLVVVRGAVYRATGDQVEYGDRPIISSPVACHAFVYKVMLSAKRYALSGEPFTPDIGRTILNDSVTDYVDARPVADWVICRGGVVADDLCYYSEAIAGSHGYCCPVVVDEPSSSRIQETTQASSKRHRKTIIQATSTDAAEDDQNDRKLNTENDELDSADIVI